MRQSSEFSSTLRSGIRYGRRNVVLYAASGNSDSESTFGFIVSKAVGNAVSRNLVKRRLREICRELLVVVPKGNRYVLRALPNAVNCEFSILRAEVFHAVAKTKEKLDQQPKSSNDQF